jgi:carboxypeptidase PM20D1
MAQALSIPEKLSEMIHIPTVYGTDQYEIARYRDKLAELFPEVFRRVQTERIGEAMLLKLPGSSMELLPVLFTGHMDVVGPVAPSEWRYPPFSGVIEGEKVWGRGALDMKGTQCALLQAANHRLQCGFTPRRTVYFYLSCDEEVGGATTAQAVETLKGRGVYLEAVFDEGGGIVEDYLGLIPGKCALLSVAEKGSLEYRFIAESSGGHAATPAKDSPIVRLSRLAVDLEEHWHELMRFELTPELRDMLLETARYMPMQDRTRLEQVLWDEAPRYPRLCELVENAEFLLGPSAAFTMMDAGTAFNVIPKVARLTVNVRTTTGQGEAEITPILIRKAEDYDVKCELVGGMDASKYAPSDSFGFQAVKRTVLKRFGEMPVLPALLMGGTDSKHFSTIARAAIRFSPVTASKEQGKGVHGINEYITIDALKEATEFYDTMFHDEL